MLADGRSASRRPEAFRTGRQEEQAERGVKLDVLEEFMPEPLSEREIETIIDDAIASAARREHPRPRAGDSGRDAAGRGATDGSAVSQLVREKLA